MDFFQFKNIIVILLGFIVWLSMAPRLNNPRYGEMFLAYMATLMFCLVGTSEIILIKPIAFFFTVGGVFAFFYLLLSLTIKVSIKKN